MSHYEKNEKGEEVFIDEGENEDIKVNDMNNYEC